MQKKITMTDLILVLRWFIRCDSRQK